MHCLNHIFVMKTPQYVHIRNEQGANHGPLFSYPLKREMYFKSRALASSDIALPILMWRNENGLRSITTGNRHAVLFRLRKS